MPELSLRNIDQISNDVRREEITFSHLLNDLIDHICCDVEYEMQSGLDFFQAYQRVRQKMGSSRRLKEIQEETLYAVDTKYRKMKNTMKFSGIAGTIIFGFASLFKIQHWPGAGILMTLGAIILALVFMPSAMGVLWKETHNRKKLTLIISGFVAGFLFISGTLFKIQHWPAAGMLLLASVAATVFVFLPALLSDRLKEADKSNKRKVYILGTMGTILYIMGMLFKIQHYPASTVLMVLGLVVLGLTALPMYTYLTWKDEAKVSPRFIFMILGSLLIIVPGALINLSLQSMYNNGYYPHLEQQQKMFETRQSSVKTVIARCSDSAIIQQMQTADLKTFEIVALIEDIQKQMIGESEGEPGKPAVNPAAITKTETGYQIKYTNLSNPFASQPPSDFLMPSSTYRQKLNKALSDYNEYLGTVLPQEYTDKFKSLLESSAYLPDRDPDEGKATMLSSLHSLEILKNNLLTAESVVLETIAKHKGIKF